MDRRSAPEPTSVSGQQASSVLGSSTAGCRGGKATPCARRASVSACRWRRLRRSSTGSGSRVCTTSHGPAGGGGSPSGGGCLPGGLIGRELLVTRRGGPTTGSPPGAGDWAAGGCSSLRASASRPPGPEPYGPKGSSEVRGGAAGQPTEAPACARVVASEAPPRNIVGPNGPDVTVRSWQTVGSTA